MKKLKYYTVDRNGHLKITLVQDGKHEGVDGVYGRGKRDALCYALYHLAQAEAELNRMKSELSENQERIDSQKESTRMNFEP